VKTLLVVASIVAFSVLIGAMLVITHLHSIVSCALTVATGLNVAVSRAEARLFQGNVEVALHDISVGGQVEGTAREWMFIVSLKRPFVFHYSLLSDFSLTVKRGSLKGDFAPMFVPVRVMRAERGLIFYGGRTYSLAEGRLENLFERRQFVFSGRVSEDGTVLTAEGKGIYHNKHMEIEGRYGLSDLMLAAWTGKNIAGNVDAEGTFAYRNGQFSAQGPLTATDLEVRVGFFTSPLVVASLKGMLFLSIENKNATLSVSEIPFAGTSFAVHTAFKTGTFEGLEVASGFFSAEEILQRVKVDNLIGGPYTLRDILSGGEVRIRRLSYGHERPFFLEMDVSDLTFAYKKLGLQGVAGTFTIDGTTFFLTNGSARSGENGFSRITGRFSIAKDRRASLQADYSVDLRDLPTLLSQVDMGDLSFRGGTTRGTLHLQGVPSKGFTLSGRGDLKDGNVLFRKVSLSASGHYSFFNDTLSLSPLLIQRPGTELVIRGTWNKDAMDLELKGALDVTDGDWPQAPLLHIKGPAQVDLRLLRGDERMSVQGLIDMEDLLVEVPGLLRKDRGTAATMNISLTRTTGRVALEHLNLSMSPLTLTAKGSFDGDAIPELHVALSSNDLTPVSRLLLLDNGLQGRLRADLAIYELFLPLTKLPRVDGSVVVEGGSAKLPGMIKPLQDIDLSARFHGDSADIHLERLRCGNTVVSAGDLRMENPAMPQFALDLAFEKFDATDFKSNREPFIPTIPEQTILARTEGSVTVLAKHIKAGSLTATDAGMRGSFRNSALTVSSLKADIMGGIAEMEGHMGFVPPSPTFSLRGKISDATGGIFLHSLGSKSEIITGPTTLSGFLATNGSTPNNMANHLSGQVNLESSAGTIERWSFLSKLLDLFTLNLNELAPGKWTPKAEGLTFRRIGATFTASEGVFHTDNFVIDSSSMLITGTGDIDVGRHQIDGSLAISPLTGIDTAIGKIPLLGSLLREEEKGLFYLTYRVKGPIDDPQITKGIGTGFGSQAAGFLKRLLLAPFERSSP
jgi:hypothetical protein